MESAESCSGTLQKSREGGQVTNCLNRTAPNTPRGRGGKWFPKCYICKREIIKRQERRQNNSRVAVVYSEIPLGLLHLSPILGTRKSRRIPWGRRGSAVAQVNQEGS